MRTLMTLLVLLGVSSGSILNAKEIDELGCLDCFNFVAPSIFGAENLNPAEVGLIVYDSEVDQFRGFSQVAGWQKLTTSISVRAENISTTLMTSDDKLLMDANGGSLTVSLPTVTSSAGKTFYIKKSDSTFYNVLIDPNGSEQIDGQTSTTLHTKGESVEIVSDGSSWQILERNIPTNLGTTTWTDSDTNTVTTVRLYRLGPLLKVVGLTAMSGSLSGTFSVTIPSELSPDFTFGNGEQYTVGSTKLIDVSVPTNREGRPSLMSQTELRLMLLNTSTSYGLLDNVNGSTPWTWANGDSINWNASWPVVGWN